MVSPNSTLPRSDEEQNTAYNPGEQHARELVGDYGSTPKKTDLPSESGSGEDSTKAVKDAEENADANLQNGFYRPSSGGKQQKITLKSFFKKKGPLTAIISLLIGGGGAFSLLLAPGLGIVQLKEVLTGDLNDQLAAFDIRSDTMFKAKLKKFQAAGSICSNGIKIRCQFGSMSKKMTAKFLKPGSGFTDVLTEDTTFGRKKIVSMTAPNGQKITDPQDLINLRRDPSVRTALNKIHNPIYASLSDNVAIKTLKARFITSKTKKLSGTTTKELDSSLKAASGGEDVSGNKLTKLKTAKDGRAYFDDANGKPVYQTGAGADPARFAELSTADSKLTAASTKSPSKLKAVSGVIRGVSGAALKGVSVIGAADTACTVYNTARIVAEAAKATRSIQLAQYAMVFLQTADSIKAGTATPEEVSYLGDIITAVDTRKMVTDELSATSGSSTDQAYDNAQARPNPFYGKSGFDSPGYAVAAYNDAPTLTTQSQQYMVGGGLSGTLSSVTDDIANTLTNGDKSALRSFCGGIQNWWVRGTGLVIGIAAAVGSFGASTALSIGASLAVGIALPFLTAALADIIAGNVVGPNTKGVEAVDATFSGTSVILGGFAQERGMKPLTKDELKPYLAKTNTIKNEYIAQGIYEAKATPFDIMNQYSFLGSFARTLNPSVTSASGSIVGALAAIPKFFSASFASIIPRTSAAVTYNPNRFNKCSDEGYAALGIAADVFCNVRYGLSDAELAMDPSTVLDYMLANGHIDNAGGAQSDTYKDFLKYCVNRSTGWGETGEEATGKEAIDNLSGAVCMENSQDNSNFRIYTLDKTVSDAMDDEAPSVSSTQSSGTIDAPVSRGFSITDGFGPRTPPCSTCSNWHQGSDFVTADKAVFAIMDGTVTEAGVGKNDIVTIKHANGLLSTYWHMPKGDILVKVGDTVTTGQRIGTMGQVGQAEGIHLHFELDISQVSNPAEYAKYTTNTGGYNPGKRVDPVDYFTKNGVAGF